MTAVIANTTFSDGVLSMAQGDIRTIADDLATAYIAAGLVAAYTGKVTPSGVKEITVNGLHDVYGYATADVDVPNPSTGTLEIEENGTYDVTDYASAEVAVEGGGGDVVYRALYMPETLTTEESGGVNYAEFTLDESLYADMPPATAMDVVIDGVAYNDVPMVFNDGYLECGAPFVDGAYDFSEYPFCFRVINTYTEAGIVMETAGTYAVTVYNKTAYTGATVTITNNTESTLVIGDFLFGTEIVLVPAGATVEAQYALINGFTGYVVNGSDSSLVVTVTGDVTWSDDDACGYIRGNGTITLSVEGGGE